MFLSGNKAMGIKLAILAIVLLAIRRIVEPKLMGQQIGLSPLATLIAMFIGLKLIGVLGLFVDRKSTRLNSSHVAISYAVFCLKKKKSIININIDGLDRRI